MARQRVRFETIPVNFSFAGWTGKTNCIVIWRRSEAVVVDPGGEGSRLIRFLKRRMLTVGAYWLTHCHPDHVLGLSELLDEFPAPVRYHTADSWWLGVSLPFVRLMKRKCFRPFEAIRRIACGDIIAKVIHVPGHSGGSVCFWFEESGVVCAGDTIGYGWSGATMFPGGDEDEMEISLQKIFRRFPDDVMILPGHGSCTTVGAERFQLYP